MRKFLLLAVILVLVGEQLSAQVSGIKQQSASNARAGRSGRGDSYVGGGGFGYFFVNFIGSGIIEWQRATLQKRGEVPSVLSLEFYGQAAVQPSNYYVVQPRLRGNWGIFFSDVRVNYLMEESIGGINDLRTSDWQVLGLNVVNAKTVTVRMSTGFMKENFGDQLSFSESVLSASWYSGNDQWGVTGEYRVAKDFETNATPRREGSVFLQRKLFDRGALHGFATAGILYQRYYSAVNVWGVQGGLAVKLY